MRPAAVTAGDYVLVFDSQAWHDFGCDAGDNMIFFRPALVLERRGEDHDAVVDVRWLGTDTVSRSHFCWGLQPWPRDSK